jgi:uncharacterized membrane protein YbaN (DUF454 family)
MGFTCLAIGFSTALVPFLPTLPFFMFAAFFLSRSSPEWHRWIRLNRQFGKQVRAWEDYGVLDLKVKIFMITCLIPTCIGPLMIDGFPAAALYVWLFVCGTGLAYVISRPGTHPHIDPK